MTRRELVDLPLLMIIPLTLLSLASPDLAAAPASMLLVAPAAVVAPQGPEVTPMPMPSPTRPPSGGTPEPGVVMLLLGAAGVYGLYRARRNRKLIEVPQG
ncbi:MAG: PEP-CTERM sorting domain-containing protein [Planctomycetota bacterium]